MTNALPSTQDIVATFAAFYREVRGVGYDVMFLFLILALIKEFLLAMEGRSNYKALFVRVFLIAGLYAIYTPFFEEVVRGMDLLSNFFMPTQDFKDQILKIFTAYREHHDLGTIALIKSTFLTIMTNVTYSLAYMAIRGFGWVRSVFLSALYISGPVFLGIGIFLPNMARIWVRWLFEVLSWNVVLSLFVRVLFEFNFFEFYTRLGTPNVDLVVMNLFIIIIILRFVPRIASTMVRGAEGFTHAGEGLLSASAGAIGRLIPKGRPRKEHP